MSENTTNTGAKETQFLPRIVITLLGTWVFTVGVVGAFAAYLFSTRIHLTSEGIYSSAPAGRLLLLPNIGSRAVLLISPVWMTLVAYKLGAEWLRSMEIREPCKEDEYDQQQNVNQEKSPRDDIRPSASQFVHLVALCSTATPKSVFTALRYLFTSGSANRASLLHAAIYTLIPLLVISYALSAVEGFWLHAATLPVLLPVSTIRPASQNLQLSRSIDKFCQQNPVYSDCDGEQILSCSLEYLGNSCADAQGAVDVLRGSDEAILTANNFSTSNIVRFVPDTSSPPSSSSLTTPSTATSLLLPYLTDEDQSQISYTATTTGVRVTCDNLTPVCNIHVAQPDDSPETGSVLYSGCPDKPGLTQGVNENNIALGPTASWNMTEFDPSAVNKLLRGQKANPFPMSLAMIFNVDLGNQTNITEPAMLGGMMHTRGPRLFGLLWCQIEVLAPVKYRNDRGNIEVLEAKSADQGSAEVWAVSGAFLGASLSAKLYTEGQASPLTDVSNRSLAFTTSYSRSVAKILLSATAGIHDLSASIEETDVKIVQTTYIPWAPLAVFSVLVISYAVFVGWVGWSVWRGTARAVGGDVGRLKAAAERLAVPGNVIFDLIGSSSGVGAEPREVKLRLGTRRDENFGVCV